MKNTFLFITLSLSTLLFKAQNNLEKEFKDEFNISGKYHLSKSISISEKEVSFVNFEFLKESDKLKVYYHATESPFYIETNSTFSQYYSTCGVFFANDNDNKLGGRIMKLEDGLFIVLAGKSNAYVSNSNCENFVFTDPNNGIIVLGKNKDRVKEVADNVDLLKKLAEESACSYRLALKCVLSGMYPFPEPGMKDAKLSAEALTVVKAQAVTAGWTQKIEYCYVKSKDWSIISNKISGAIVARTMRLIAVMKNPDGRCQWEEVEVRQDYNGTSYGKTYFSGNTRNIMTVDCTTAMKHK